MRFLSVCSGIEAASVAWGPLGWEATNFSEVEPFPSAVLAHHYPHVTNLGDMRTIAGRLAFDEIEVPELLCGGTPCQAFSVAGARKSLEDDRGNLTLTFVGIADEIDIKRSELGLEPGILFWENVPGVLNTKDNAFGCFLAGLAGEHSALEPGHRPPEGKQSRYWKWDKRAGAHTPAWPNAGLVVGPKRTVAWRVLDAQYFGVAQRRRRVFVVASARDGFDPGAVLFEFEGPRRDSAPRRGAWKEPAGSAGGCVAFGGNNTAGPIDVATALNACSSASGRLDFESETFLVQPALYSIMPMNSGRDYKAREVEVAQPLMAGGPVGGNQGGDVVLQPITVVHGTQDPDVRIDLAHTLGRNNGGENVIVLPFDTTQITSPLNYSKPNYGDPCHPLAAGAHIPAIAYSTKLHNTGSNNAGKIFEERTTCLDANSPPPALLTAMQVRRLTPRECERLQGFPDNYTRIPWKLGYWPADKHPAEMREAIAEQCPNGPRYKALGNSWAVPNVRWIGSRIDRCVKGLLPAPSFCLPTDVSLANVEDGWVD